MQAQHRVIILTQVLFRYVMVFLILAHGHTIASYFDMFRVSRVLGVGYIIVKVGLLLTTEVNSVNSLIDTKSQLLKSNHGIRTIKAGCH